MKTFILCGGYGTRLDAEGKRIPKALIKIGGDPIILHLIKTFIKFDIKEFVLCLGYKKNLITQFFLKRFKTKIKITKKKKFKLIEINLKKKIIKIYLVDTGLNSGTGGRIKLANNIIKNKNDFLMTYCDGLANVNVDNLVNRHKSSNKLVTVTAVQPKHRYGIMKIQKNLVTEFNNTNPIQNIRVNGGYFVINPKSLKFIKNKKIFWETEPMNNLIKKKELACYNHNKFWASLDTQKDKKYFNDLWKNKKIYWE
tara:strand:+ start:776 stop:1537 length:762 start_codon:yes stop_codon:yes gene_type:complete